MRTRGGAGAALAVAGAPKLGLSDVEQEAPGSGGPLITSGYR
jgi:hypothetical protein